MIFPLFPRRASVTAAAPYKASAEYQKAFQAVTSSVLKNVLKSGANSLFEIHDAIRQDLGAYKRADLVRLFAEDAERLLDRKIGHALVDRSAAPPGPEQDMLMQRLAGSWLALYFLGCPFMQAWEGVAILAEGAGFPGGPSLFKAVGDVYRDARKYNLEVANQGKPGTVHVLDHNPLAMRKMLNKIERSEAGEQAGKQADADFAFSTQLTFLGMLYERLQLALYLHAGGPMYFYVPADSLRALLSPQADAEAVFQEKWKRNVREMWDQLQSCFPSKFIAKQFVRVVYHEELNLLPGCVLTSRHAIYRTRGANKSASPWLPGNYLPERVRLQFIRVMEGVEKVRQKAEDRGPDARQDPPFSPSLQTCSLEQFEKICLSPVS